MHLSLLTIYIYIYISWEMNFHILSLNFQFIFLNKVYMNNQRIETSCQSIRIFNVQLTSTLFARQETQIIRQLFFQD